MASRPRVSVPARHGRAAAPTARPVPVSVPVRAGRVRVPAVQRRVRAAPLRVAAPMASRPRASVPAPTARAAVPMASRPTVSVPAPTARAAAPMASRPTVSVPAPTARAAAPMASRPTVSVPAPTARAAVPMASRPRASVPAPTARAVGVAAVARLVAVVTVRATRAGRSVPRPVLVGPVLSEIAPAGPVRGRQTRAVVATAASVRAEGPTGSVGSAATPIESTFPVRGWRRSRMNRRHRKGWICGSCRAVSARSCGALPQNSRRSSARTC